MLSSLKFLTFHVLFPFTVRNKISKKSMMLKNRFFVYKINCFRDDGIFRNSIILHVRNKHRDLYTMYSKDTIYYKAYRYR